MSDLSLTLSIAAGFGAGVFLLTFFVFLKDTLMDKKTKLFKSLIWGAAAFAGVCFIWWATENLADIGSK